MYNSIIIGAGCAGATVARKLAEEGGQKVLVLEKRNHIAGNCYDAFDENGILIHVYGPHIFHTNIKSVYEYLSRFTKWYEYQHEVVADVHGKLIPVPFNLNTLSLVYDEPKALELKEKLIDKFGMGSKVPILELMNSDDEDIKGIADYVYKNIFLGYTMKQWGQKPEDIDPAVTARVPVFISYDNRYFQDQYQGMPLDGYTPMFENMFNHDNITVELGVDAKDRMEFKDGKIYYEGEVFEGSVIYTGQTDALFDNEFGMLPYRTLDFAFENYKQESYQGRALVNYTVDQDYTRITEFKYLTNQKKDDCTTIVKEYPKAYTGNPGETPYYAIMNNENISKYNKYKKESEKFGNLILLGRLAEYKYYNIDAIVDKAINVADGLILKQSFGGNI